MAGYEVGLDSVFDGDVGLLRNSYRNVTNRLDARLVLDHYGAQNVYEHRGRNGPELVHSCLIDRVDPHHSHGDARPSAHFNRDTLQYHCWSYGGGDIFWFIFQMEQSVKRGQEILSGLLQGTIDGPDTENLLEDLNKLIHGDQTYFQIPFYHPRILEKWKRLHPYLYEDRRLDPEVLMAHQVGYNEEEVRLVLPHFWKGKLVGWQRRALDSPKYPMTPPVWVPEKQAWKDADKYKNSTNFPKHTTLGNLPEKADTVLLVESPMSVYSGESFGLKIPVVETFGSKVTPEQIKHLRQFSKVITWFDPDMAGRIATLNVYRLLHDYSRVFTVDDLFNPEEEDLADHYWVGHDLMAFIESAQPTFLLEERIRDELGPKVQQGRGREGR